MADPSHPNPCPPHPLYFYLWFSFPGTVQCRKIKYTNKTLNPSLYVARVKSIFFFLIRTWQSLFNIYIEEFVWKFKAKKILKFSVCTAREHFHSLRSLLYPLPFVCVGTFVTGMVDFSFLPWSLLRWKVPQKNSPLRPLKKLSPSLVWYSLNVNGWSSRTRDRSYEAVVSTEFQVGCLSLLPGHGIVPLIYMERLMSLAVSDHRLVVTVIG